MGGRESRERKRDGDGEGEREGGGSPWLVEETREDGRWKEDTRERGWGSAGGEGGRGSSSLSLACERELDVP